MASRKEHCKDCKEQLGKDWSQRKIAKEVGCSRGNVEYIIKN